MAISLRGACSVMPASLRRGRPGTIAGSTDFSPASVRKFSDLMLAPLDRPIVCPITVGREPHLAALDRLLDQLVAGQGQTLLTAGEAGIGKSRLVAETKLRAAERG